ncbi:MULTISPECIES: helix-turn-helix domain-containing protein [Oceanicaulis]|uniref:helix-turn-helix domain-containing protein n=1 Tax=Oceanicaulis TaxID=153232 RepID=UPI002352916B|nr:MULTISPECIES: helix-turn-helix domain-containing protein [Oceanicaulis]
MTSHPLPLKGADMLVKSIEAIDAPYKLIAPRLGATQDPSLIKFIEVHFDALTPHLNWFTVELFFQCGVARGLAYLDRHASKRISTQKILADIPGSSRFTSVVMNNAGQTGYVEIQSKSGFIENIRRFIAVEALNAGASTAEVAHLCGVSVRTVQRLQRSGVQAQAQERTS